MMFPSSSFYFSSSFVIITLVLVSLLFFSVFSTAQKTSTPFKEISLDSYAIPPLIAGGVLIRGQAAANDYSIPPGNYIHFPPSSTSSSASSSSPPFYNLANFSTSIHATGYDTSTNWKNLIANAVYTSDKPTTDSITWWTVELYTYSTNAEPSVGFVPNPALSFDEAVQRCVSYSSVHLNPDNEFDKVLVSGLSTRYVEKRNLSSQWIGVAQKSSSSSSTTTNNNGFEYSAVAGPRIGQTFAYSDGSGGCSASTNTSCNWAPNEPSATTFSNAVVSSDYSKGNKWSTISSPTGVTKQSWCSDYPVHLWLVCKIDSTKGTDGAACLYNPGDLVPPTFPARTTGGAATTAPATTSTSSTNNPVATDEATTSSVVVPSPTSSSQQAAPTASPPTPATTTPTTQPQTTQQTPSPPEPTPNPTTLPTTTTANNNNNNNNAAGTEEPKPEETSPGARAGIIFGVGIPTVLLVVGGLWFIRKKMMERSAANGKQNLSEGSSAKKMNYSVVEADQELVESLFATSV